MVLRYWKISDLDAVGFHDTLRYSAENDYDCTHRARKGRYFQYDFDELIRSPYFRWLFLLSDNFRFDVNDDEKGQIKRLYEPFVFEDRYLAAEVSHYAFYCGWDTAKSVLTNDDKKTIKKLLKLRQEFDTFHISQEEIMFRDLLSIFLEDDDVFKKLASSIRINDSDVLHSADFRSPNCEENVKRQNLKLQMYVIEHMPMLIKKLVKRSESDTFIEHEYVSSDFVMKLNVLSEHIKKMSNGVFGKLGPSVTDPDKHLVEFIFRVAGDVEHDSIDTIVNRYDSMVSDVKINWRLLIEQCSEAHQIGNIPAGDEFNMFEYNNSDKFWSSSTKKREVSNCDYDVNESSLLDIDALDSDNSSERQDLVGWKPDSDFDGYDSSLDDDLDDSFVDSESEVSDNEIESHLEVVSAAPSFSLLSHSESPMTFEDALPMSAESSFASDDDLLVSDSVTSTDVSEADLSDLLVSSDSSDSQSDS